MSGGAAWTGTCAFRMMPSDPLVEGPSTAVVTTVGDGFTLHYTWEHPADGPQQGVLLVGGADESARVEASWLDTWHHHPGLMTVTGPKAGARIHLRGTYAPEWGWTVTLELGDEELSMTMDNVVPASAVEALPPDSPPMSAGPYEVMVASWRPDPAG